MSKLRTFGVIFTAVFAGWAAGYVLTRLSDIIHASRRRGILSLWRECRAMTDCRSDAAFTALYVLSRRVQ